MMTRSLSLGSRLTLYLLVLLVALLGLQFAFYRAEVDERRNDRVAAAERTARNAAAALEAFVGDIESTALAMTIAIGRQALIDQPTTGAYLAGIATAKPQLRAIFVTDAAGRVIATSATGLGTDLASRPYMQALTAGRPRVWSGSLTGIESGEITVAYGQRIDPSRGYLIFAFFPERLLDSLDLAVAEDFVLTLTDDKGLVLFDSDRSRLGAGERDLSAVPEVRRALAGEVVNIIDTAAPYPGQRRYGALVPVDRVGWVLAYTSPQAALEGQLRDELVRNMAVTALVLLLAGLFIVAVARGLTLPLARLARTAAAIAEGGRPQVQVEEAGGREVRQLSAAMSAMSRAVSQREDELRRLYAEAQAAFRERATLAEENAQRYREAEAQAAIHVELNRALRESAARVEALNQELAAEKKRLEAVVLQVRKLG